MLKVNKILFPTDFSRCAKQALKHALFLAGKYRASLDILHVVELYREDPHSPESQTQESADFQQLLEDHAASRMASEFSNISRGQFSVRMVRRRGFSAADVILEHAGEMGIDLIVMGTNGKQPLERLFLGSVAEKVVRLAPCPVLTVREKRESGPVDQRKRLLVPIDFSELGILALRYAKEICHVYKAELDLLHVIEDKVHPIFYGTGKTIMSEFRPDIVDRVERSLLGVFNKAPGPLVNARVRAVFGKAAREIVEYSKREAVDLVIESSRGLTGIRHLLIGSVAEQVVRTAPCPVLVVKTGGNGLLQGRCDALAEMSSACR